MNSIKDLEFKDGKLTSNPNDIDSIMRVSLRVFLRPRVAQEIYVEYFRVLRVVLRRRPIRISQNCSLQRKFFPP